MNQYTEELDVLREVIKGKNRTIDGLTDRLAHISDRINVSEEHYQKLCKSAEATGVKYAALKKDARTAVICLRRFVDMNASGIMGYDGIVKAAVDRIIEGTKEG